MALYNTRLNNFQKKFISYLFQGWNGSWRNLSLGLITLLLGFYLGSNLTVYYLQVVGQRPFVVLIMVLLIEILIRFRSRVSSYPWPILWLSLDNLRIGAVYAVVLEAFKLGS